MAYSEKICGHYFKKHPKAYMNLIFKSDERLQAFPHIYYN